MTLAGLLRAEDDRQVAEFTCPETGIAAWTQIRAVFHRMAISDQLYGTPLEGAPRPVPRMQAATTLARSMLHNASLRLTRRFDAPVCIFTDGIGDSRTDGRWFNRLSDHFALARPADTLTIEDQFEWRWPFPRATEPVLLHAPLQALIHAAARWRLREQHVMRAREFVDFVSARAERILGWRPGPQREQRLTAMLARKLAALPVQLAAYEKLFERLRPRLVMLLAGVYGPSAALIVAARRRRIVTAEFQHGVIAGGHDAYNFAPAMLASSIFRASLPEHFLSYGDWWNRQINAPLQMTTIGNPFRSEKLARLSATAARDVVLVLSDGSEFPMYLEFAAEIAAALGGRGLRVVLRPHPAERSQVAARYGSAVGTVQIDQNADLYASLTSANSVITELSTALFEAVGVAGRVFMWNTPKARFMFPELPFPVADSAAALIEKVRDSAEGRVSDALAGDIWADDWQRRYRAFLSQHAGVA